MTENTNPPMPITTSASPATVAAAPPIVATNAKFYSAERASIEKKAWDRRFPILAGLIVLLMVVFAVSQALNMGYTPILERENVGAHKTLIYAARINYDSLNQAFAIKEKERARREACAEFIEEMKKREQFAEEQSSAIHDRAYTNFIAGTEGIENDHLQIIFSADHLDENTQPENDKYQQQSHLFAAVAKDTARYMEHGYGKKAFDEGPKKTRVELLGCSFILQSRYPGNVCISNITDTPANNMIKTMLEEWFGDVQQREPIVEYCEGLFNRTYPSIVRRLENDSKIFAINGKAVKCPSPFVADGSRA